uniref:Uncharacterized protein n=1 Tax=Rhizophora mucronata TaxID=61149 RepID=A0A2P2R500_RHIMU
MPMPMPMLVMMRGWGGWRGWKGRWQRNVWPCYTCMVHQ